MEPSLAALVPTLQAEAGRVELELSMTKLRVEEASLRDSLSKLSALNESLAQDKLGLNHLIAQVCPPALPTCGSTSETAQGYPRPSLGPPTPHASLLHISLYTSVRVPICLGPCLFLSLTPSVCLSSLMV